MRTNSVTLSNLIERDQACIWHPFTQQKTARPPIPLTHGRGAYLFSSDGEAYLDAISSWWVNLHGHAHPYIAERLAAQLPLLDQASFADFTHESAVQLAERLLRMVPGDYRRVFYSDNGSTAYETALKMALQYRHNKGEVQCRRIVCLRDGYHGDTFGSMSSCGKHAFNRPFWNYLFQIEQIDPPYAGCEEKSLNQLRTLLEAGDVSCFVFEPLLLGVAGMKIYPPAGLDALLALCRAHDVVTIADEVLTGFGRTGPLFATGFLEEQPDILCLAKGLTGGVLSLGATLCREKIFEAFLSDERSKALLHGHTYTGNPLACTAALANLDLLDRSECDEQRATITTAHRGFVARWKNHPRLTRCESLGTALALDYAAGATSYFNSMRDRLYTHFIEKKIYLRPFGNTLHILPPYCISVEDLERIYAEIIYTLDNL